MSVGNIMKPLAELQSTVQLAKKDIIESFKGIDATVMITGQFPYSVARSLNERLRETCGKIEFQMNNLVEAGKDEDLYELRKLVVQVIVTDTFLKEIRSSIDRINLILSEVK